MVPKKDIIQISMNKYSKNNSNMQTYYLHHRLSLDREEHFSTL